VRTALIEVSGLVAAEAEWRALFLATPEANPFYGPDFLMPLIAHLGPRAGVRAVTAHLCDDAGGPLLAFCPVVRPSRLLPVPGLVASLTGPFVFDGLPLLRAGHEAAAWRAIIAALAPQARILRLDQVRLDLGGVEALRRVARFDGLALVTADRAARAALIPDATAPAPRGSLLKDLRRRERRLGEAGTVGFEGATAGARAGEGVEAFLALERAGWKGRAGTALASRPAGLAFARAALAAGNSAPAVRVDLLTLDNRVIAAAPNLAGPTRAAAFKSAFDESLARLSPGVVLDARVREHVAGARWCACLDSGTAPDHPISEIWTQRIEVGTLFLALRPEVSGEELSQVAARLARLKRLREAAKALAGTVRARR
jgi:CelD/BcsL family acetyltransferase involved in cellulose biosynthesis